MSPSLFEGMDRARELRRELKAEWAELWKTRFDDEVRAEGISSQDFKWLFVDRGEILFASRDFKAPSFSEILDKHLGPDMAGKVDPDPKIGGWRRFARENFLKPNLIVPREHPQIKIDADQQQRKQGRGWLNKAKILKKTSSHSFGY